MTFDEFVTQNNNRVKGTVDQDLYTMVSNATGIPASNISIVSYDIPMFEYSKGSGRGFQDYLQIILAVLIFALLGYVVFRSTLSLIHIYTADAGKCRFYQRSI